MQVLPFYAFLTFFLRSAVKRILKDFTDKKIHTSKLFQTSTAEQKHRSITRHYNKNMF